MRIVQNQNEIVFNFYKSKRTPKTMRHNVDFFIIKNIRFSDDFWDLRVLNTKKRDNTAYQYHFEYIHEPFRYYAKLLIFEEIFIKKNAFETAIGLFNVIRTVTKVFYEQGINEVLFISEKLLEQYINKLSILGRSYHYLEGLSVAFIKFLKVVQEIDNLDKSDCIEYLYEIAKECNANRPPTAENDYIPDNFLNQIVAQAIKDLKNENLPVKERLFAGLLVIVAETGMRIGELILLETNQLDSRKFKDKENYYLNFLTFKTNNYTGNGRETFCKMTDLAVLAYKTCEKLVNQIIDNLNQKQKEKLLYFYHTGVRITKECLSAEQRQELRKIPHKKIKEYDKLSRKYIYISPINGMKITTKSTLIERLQQFIIRNEKDINLSNLSQKEYSAIDWFSISSESKYKKFFNVEQKKLHSYLEVKKINFPYVNFHRFRVTVCTKLFKKGVHLDFIMKHMNHISDEMTQYYNKSHIFENELEESIQILSRITNEAGLIEMDPSKIEDKFLHVELQNPEVVEKINKINDFLKENKLHLYENFGKVFNLLKKASSPFTENDFGICVRSLAHGICERKKYFSSMSDNYFIGIQLNTLKFLSYNYKRFLQKKEIVFHNYLVQVSDSRYKTEYNREKKALERFVSKTLSYELNLLKNELKTRKQQQILEEYPELEEIITNLESIKKEVEEWIVS